jgi:hypothetical protein
MGGLSFCPCVGKVKTFAHDMGNDLALRASQKAEKVASGRKEKPGSPVLPIFRLFHGIFANGIAFATRQGATQIHCSLFALEALMYVLFLPSVVAVAVIGFITLRDQFQFAGTSQQ